MEGGMVVRMRLKRINIAIDKTCVQSESSEHVTKCADFATSSHENTYQCSSRTSLATSSTTRGSRAPTAEAEKVNADAAANKR